MKDKEESFRAKSKQESCRWQPHYILVLIIIMQAGFMVFMGTSGPAHHHSRAKMAPRSGHSLSKKGWNAEIKSSSQDRSLRSQDEPVQNIIDPDVLKRHQATILKAKTKTKPPKTTTPPQYKSMVQEKEWEVSSTEFPGALHFHFVQEQKDPFFRNLHPPKTESELMDKFVQAETYAVTKMARKKAVLKSCVYYSKETKQLRFSERCFGPKNRKGIIAYNPQPFTRTWCGKTIQPDSVQYFSKPCVNAPTEPARLLLADSDKTLGTQRRDFKGLPPIVFERIDSHASVEAVQDCDVPCKFTMDTCKGAGGKDTKGPACLPDISDFRVQGTDFKFRYSMLDPRSAPEALGISRKGYRENQFYATRSFLSEIPLSTFDWEKYGNMNSPHNDFKRAGEKGICFMHLNPCMGEIKPGAWTSKLQETFKGNFDYYGPCNFGPSMKATPTDLDLENHQDRQTIMSQYMFTLIIGHSQNPDMMTDLVWDALAAGSIPVYHGTPNIREHVPPNSIIVGGEHSSREALAEHLDKIREDRAMWKEFHAWRDDEKGTSLIEDKYGFLKQKSSNPFCRMCRWAMAAKFALGWDPIKQTIEKPAMDRNFCVSPKDELKFPIEELWMSDLTMQKSFGRKVCDKEWSDLTYQFDDLTVTRRVVSHDNGVIDIAITDITSLRENLRLVLRLNFRGPDFKGIANAHGAHIPDPHQVLGDEEKSSDNIPLMSSITIQDEKTRATVITNWVTKLSTPKGEGLIDVLVRDLRKPGDGTPKQPKEGNAQIPRLMEDEILKIRIILEDVNLLRDATTEYNLSPYARLMIADFLDPLMFFYDTTA